SIKLLLAALHIEQFLRTLFSSWKKSFEELEQDETPEAEMGKGARTPDVVSAAAGSTSSSLHDDKADTADMNPALDVLKAAEAAIA
ncbi:unnamed protein product, partial [Amoebophrya sp. A120]